MSSTEQDDSAAKVETEPQPDVESQLTRPCYLLTVLPAELRTVIYEYILAPGALILTSTRAHRYAVQPSLTTALLRTCKQIYHEARQLPYIANEIIFSINAHDTFWPTIDKKRLPRHVLRRLQHVCVVLDCTDKLAGTYEEVDFTAFGAMVNVKMLRLAMVYGSEDRHVVCIEQGHELLEQLLARLPRTRRLDIRRFTQLGRRSPQQKFLERVIANPAAPRRSPGTIRALEPMKFVEIFTRVRMDVVRSKSGANLDVIADTCGALRWAGLRTSKGISPPVHHVSTPRATEAMLEGAGEYGEAAYVLEVIVGSGTGTSNSRRCDLRS